MPRRAWLALAAVLIITVAGLVVLRTSVGGGLTSGAAFDGQRAYAHVKAQCDLGPRPAGSPAAAATAAYISEQLRVAGWQSSEQMFPYRGATLRNVIAQRGSGSGAAIIVGAHYDTRSVADHDPQNPRGAVPGANDGASGVAVLLELARVLGEPKRPVVLAFFDGEDQGNLDGWEWCVGSSYMAANLKQQAEAMVLLDMIGDSDQGIYWEANSDAALRAQLWTVASDQGYGQQFIARVKYNLIDDHIAFLRRGIPAVDIIDFDYTYWHTTQDTPDKVSPLSLECVGRVVERWLQR